MPILAAEAPTPPNKIMTSGKEDHSVGKNGLGSVTGLTAAGNSTIPILSLDCDVITDSLAAKLAMSLIGHVLFLKSQVPLPVVQLLKLSDAKSSAKALKQRNELLSSFDTLTSHLNTTFTALSSALAKIRASAENNHGADTNCGRVYMGIFVGSSTASAKAKVMFAVDGLEIKAIGARDDKCERQQGTDDLDDDMDKDAIVDEEDVDSELTGGGDSGEEGDEEEDDEEGDEDEDEYVDNEEDEAETDEETDSESSLPPDSRPSSPEPSYPSHAAQQKALQAAERLLSRTLALADADGYGMSADLAPLQTYILLRAPRRFDHPAWLPRQSISASMESTLNEFLEESGVRVTQPQNAKPQKTQKRGKGVEGVWVVGRSGLNTSIGKDEAYASVDEWDEMIWWTWDGKLAGFSDW